MKWSTLHATVLPSLLTGTSRHPLAGDGELEMLSLMGQALRFERPTAPEAFLVEPKIADDRRILSERLRRPLVRILNAKNATEHPARALARTFDRLRLRPHPFDLPLIEAFVRSNAEKLGLAAQHWANRQKPDSETQGYFDAAALGESNWTQATPSRRVAYLEQRRLENPDAARSLLQSTWVQEDAEARFRLLEGLEIGLSAGDQPFLSSLEKDRAPRVRALAARLLRRLGAGGDNPALGECLKRIKQGQSGLIRKRLTLQLELPANVQDDMASRWVHQTFAEVSYGELKNAFAISEQEMIEAAAKDERLLLALALMATSERRLDLLELVVVSLPNAWERLFESGLQTLGAMQESERQRWQEIIVQPYRKDLPTMYLLWDYLHCMAAQETSPVVMSMILGGHLLTKIPELERENAPWTEVIAAMCPKSHRQNLRNQLAKLNPSQTVTALALLEILDGMENDR